MSPSVVPAPVSIDAVAGDPLRLTSDVHIAGDPDAATHLSGLITARTGLGSCVVSAGGSITLRIEPGLPESYRIAVDSASASVIGGDAAGLFYGVQTLAQLVTRTDGGFEIPAVRIEDAPRFEYRGVMLDVARHFHPTETVKAYIDRAAALKFNALHLHLTDDQGWRVQLHSRPELTALASGTSVGGDPGGCYTQDEYGEIVAHAASRHMIVVPEIDLPGHTHAVGLAYPELAEDPVLDAAMRAQAHDAGEALPVAGQPYGGTLVGFSSLHIHNPATYDFVSDVLIELAALTPGPYLHIGGDEALGTAPEDFALFLERASGIAAALGKTPIAWHEAGDVEGLAPTTIGQYWGFTTPTDGMDEKARGFVANGSRVLLSPADAAYLDMKYDADAALGLTWANGPTSVERAYSWDPGAVIDGIAETGILGVEAPMFSETVRALADIDELAFPRIAAIAEAAWSPAPHDSALRTWASFRERVGAVGPLWTSLGIGFHESDEIPWVVG